MIVPEYGLSIPLPMTLTVVLSSLLLLTDNGYASLSFSTVMKILSANTPDSELCTFGMRGTKAHKIVHMISQTLSPTIVQIAFVCYPV